MKRILYLLVLLFCFSGCKKTEINSSVRFAMIDFKSKTGYEIIVKRQGVVEDFTATGVPLGECEFEIYNYTTNDKVLDVKLDITGPTTYYLIQPNINAAPIVVKALDASQEPAPAPGLMKINMANLAQLVLPGPKMAAVILSTYKSTAYEPADTVHEITADYMKSFLSLVRPVRTIGSTRIVQTKFRFSFINPETNEPVKNYSGATYITGDFFLPNSPPNIFTILFTYSENLDPALNVNCIEKGGKYYTIIPIYL